METASSFSTSADTSAAVNEAYADLWAKLGGPPTWMAVHATYQHPGEVITATLQALALGVPFQGGTTCLGTMTEAGFHSDDGVSLGLFGIRDPQGTYAVGSADTKPFARRAGHEAISKALRQANRDTPPALVWITCAPGNEEEVLAGIEDGLIWSKHTPIIGGSSADNTIEGNWYQITTTELLRDGVVVTAMYPSSPIRYAFDSSYTPTRHEGIITRASGRTVHEIDHRPAADVYNEWTDGLIADYLDGGNILSPSTLHPLGRKAMVTRDGNLYQLSHPEAVLEDRALSLFTNATPGEMVALMESSTGELVSSVKKLIAKALLNGFTDQMQISGALIIYCAGCMLAVQDEMHEVAEQFRQGLGGQPFLGLYTFGEQGCALLGENGHANLMMSIVAFEK